MPGHRPNTVVVRTEFLSNYDPWFSCFLSNYDPQFSRKFETTTKVRPHFWKDISCENIYMYVYIYIYISCQSVCDIKCLWHNVKTYIYISSQSVCDIKYLWHNVKRYIYIYHATVFVLLSVCGIMWNHIYIYITCQSVCDIVHMPSCCDVIPCGFMSFFQSMMTLRDLERHWRVFYPWCPCDILRDPERPWGTMRDIDVFFWHSEGPWETLRDVERPWGTLRDWFFLKVWGTLSVLERPWGTWETVRDLRDLEEVWETVWTNFSETLRELEKQFLKNNLRNLEGTWETVR